MRIVCEPIGYVERGEASLAEARGREEVVALDEELMRKPAVIRLRREYCEGIRGIRRGALLWVLWYAHLAPSGRRAPLLVHPYRDERLPLLGVFATRSPARPCPIGLSLVYVANVHDCSLEVVGLDALNGTPVLDLKLYYEGLDSPRRVLERAGGAHSG